MDKCIRSEEQIKKRRESKKRWALRNKEKVRKSKTEYAIRKKKSNPWLKTYISVIGRCKCKSSSGYARYGARGIKVLMKLKDYEFLWFRDKAYEMKKPSIDRIDPDKNYELSNCRYIEHSLNSSLGARIRRTNV